MSSVKCLVHGVAFPRSAILIDMGGGSTGGRSDSATGIGVVRIGTNPGRSEETDDSVTGVGGGAGGGDDIKDVGVRDVGEVTIAVCGGRCVLVG